MARRTLVDRKKEAKPKPKLSPIKCKGCGTMFIPKDRRQHFHSSICRENFYDRTYFAKASVRMTCPNCSTVFISTKPGRQMYCTPACRVEHQHNVRENLAASVSAERKTFLGDRFAALESADFKCSYCGRSTHDGVKLDVEQDGKGGLRTVCNLCVEGREFNKAGKEVSEEVNKE
jgi:ribosomal protein S27E